MSDEDDPRSPRPAATRGRLLSWMLLIFTTAGGLVALEIALRFIFPVPGVIHRFDDRLLHALIPGSKKIFVHHPGNGGVNVLVEVNSAGFRGPEVDWTEPSDRVVVYGDSFIEGYFSRIEDTFVAKLEAKLRAARARAPPRGEGVPARVRVINAGVAGYGPDQISLRMESELAELDPDLVIVSVFAGNDFGEAARNKLFRLHEGDVLVENHPTIGPLIRRDFERRARERAQLAIVRALASAKRAIFWPEPPLAEVQRNYLADSLAQQTREWEQFIERGDDVVENLFADTYDADVNLFPESKSAAHKIRTMEAILRRMDGIAAENGTRWILVIIPDPMDCGRDYDVPVDRVRFPTYDPRRLTRTLAEIATRVGISHVDLFETMREREGERLFFRWGDNHWNAVGQERSASAVARFVLDGDFLPRGKAHGARALE